MLLLLRALMRACYALWSGLASFSVRITYICSSAFLHNRLAVFAPTPFPFPPSEPTVHIVHQSRRYSTHLLVFVYCLACWQPKSSVLCRNRTRDTCFEAFLVLLLLLDGVDAAALLVLVVGQQGALVVRAVDLQQAVDAAPLKLDMFLIVTLSL